MKTLETTMSKPAEMPTRLHHNAYVTKDMETTRKFYEELIGMPLIATWAEKTDLFGRERVYCHCFFSLEDGGALAFFQFATDEDHAEFGPEIPKSPFHHIALNVTLEQQEGIFERITAAGYTEPENYYVLEHGYCHSLYIFDPNGLIVEFTADHPDVAQINADRKADAHDTLAKWLAGDHTPNNTAYQQ
jgi:glyoxylase I family protein